MGIDRKSVDLQQLAHDMGIYARQELSTTGAAVISLVQVLSYDYDLISIQSGEYVTRLTRKPDPENRGANDKGTDYLAMARVKAARRLRFTLGQDIDDPQVRRGEDEATGDDARWVGEGLLVIAAFSGGSTEQDKQVAEWGVDKFRQQYFHPNTTQSLTAGM